MSADRVGESSELIRARVEAARQRQHERFTNLDGSNVVSNADMRVGEIRKFCQLQAEGQSLMRAAMDQLNLSARAYHRILKLARTIADLAGSEEIQSPHLAEALRASRSNVRSSLIHLRVYAIRQSFSLQPGNQVLRRHPRHVSTRGYACAGNMRGDDQVLQR